MSTARRGRCREWISGGLDGGRQGRVVSARSPGDPRSGTAGARPSRRPSVPKGTRCHDLRHYYASTLIAANLNPKSIQRRLGHATISETFDTYRHLFPGDEDLGRGAIDAEIEKDLAEQSRNKKEA
ncbi:tyrosine-type recombinase/integrase [Nonomuraea sp. NPDC050691]|uniref:tyrosine-type recombinase/integrase n=1 Tax=Nonomuraea sp. NPDC050691 TaxID=3155661 RepID=UPI0034021EE3